MTKEYALQFDENKAFDHLKSQLDIGPRIPGSKEINKTREYIISNMPIDWKLTWQSFVPNESWNDEHIELVNLIFSNTTNPFLGPQILIGAHYDTRKYATNDLTNRTAPVPGANDGASGVAVLLELARIISLNNWTSYISLAFFDAEDQGQLEGWPWIVGSTYMAQHMPKNHTIGRVVILDMIGDDELNIYQERSSTDSLVKEIWDEAAALQYNTYFLPEKKYTIIDDHQPFLKKGIPSVDIIDFDYPEWHTTKDDINAVSAKSLGIVGRTIEAWLYSLLGLNADNRNDSLPPPPVQKPTRSFLFLAAFATLVIVTYLRKVKKRTK